MSHVVAVLSRIRDGIAHSLKSGVEDQIYDQLHLMDTLKICVLRLISGLHQRIEASLHQGAHAAAEDCLLAEQIGFCLFFKGSL